MLILASNSPRRRELLAALDVEFTVTASGVDESLTEAERANPAGVAVRMAERLAVLKARAVMAARRPGDMLPGDIVLGADTVVILDGQPLGKPADPPEAQAMLRALRGREHRVATGVAAVRTGKQPAASTVVVSTVTMRHYDDDEITAYIARGEPFDKAGGYAIQDTVFAPGASIDGCTCAVIGLPLWTVCALLTAAGIEAGAPPCERCAACPERPG